jgi:hypothetical protein
MLIDRLLPNFDTTKIKRIKVAAEPHEVYAAILQLDFTALAVRSRVLCAFICLRELPQRVRRLPNRIYRWFRGRKPLTLEATSYQLAELNGCGAWVKLAEKPDEEFVFGLIGKFWQLHYGAMPIKAQEFAAFAQPGYAKTACSFVVQPDGAGHSLVTYEVRTATTDATARRWFSCYWRSIAPCVAYLMQRALRAIKDEVESHAVQPISPTAPAMLEHTA